MTPDSVALRSSPTRARAVMSVTTFALRITSSGISFLVGWSLPEAMMSACGRSQLRSRTHSPPGVGEDDVGVAHGILRGGAGGEGVAELGGHLVAKRRVLDHVARCVGLPKPYTVAAERAMASAMTPVPMKATLFAPFTARSSPPQPPPRPFACPSVPVLVQHGLWPPLAASRTTNTPDPAGRPSRRSCETPVGQLHRPRWSALDVPALDVAVAGPRRTSRRCRCASAGASAFRPRASASSTASVSALLGATLALMVS